ncbi:6-phospho-3-hexuloisomerase [Flavobacterium sp. MC2016-06]|jgi:6-phospho-3-hexuloisomerase|uniref:6-phospho-3-hexuloisomerase n=1 Tax=Flavobacterium sp. MC2016-06 TaxID=2676308 RepID=UPI0012BACDA6|nr:6-phospho-3-hexuloisomerase [Flavobacterium sp. MC2016-06]MBU3862433.1 6-phospho-3-hexuloisomerase [Flavobacterium sp. MC2016-06]
MDNTPIISKNLNLILEENLKAAHQINPNQINTLIQEIQKADRIFVMGTGRSGLALKMGAMRLMHLGYTVYVVGEIVTPAILEGDLLIVASGSGTTSTVVSAVEKANKLNASVVVLTADPLSIIAKLANHIVQIPAAVKTDFGESVSAQYAGSLFEQFTLMVLETIFMTLWQESGLTKQDIWPRHANLE